MAIIRQSRQARLGRIGIISTDTGAAQMYQSMANAGQNIANSVLPQLKQEAEQRGINAAKEVNRQNLIEFDAEGNPKALTVPESFGTIAASAYQTVVERRFNESMQEEIQNKSIELTTKFTSDGKINVQGYSDQMASYLNAMDKASGGRFNEFISNTGRSIMTETQGKLAIVAAKKAREDSIATAKYTTFKALENLNDTVVFAVTPESLNDVNERAQAYTSAAQEEFALTGDRIAFEKNIKLGNHGQAAAFVNLLSNSTRNLSESQKAIITASIVDMSELPRIEDILLRNHVLQIHRLAPSILNDLQSSFVSRTNALDKVQKARDDEYLSLPETVATLENFNAQSFNNVMQVIGAGESLVTNAPETSKDEMKDVMLNKIASTFKSSISMFVLDSPDKNDLFINNLEAAILQNNLTNENLKALPTNVRADVISMINNLTIDERKSIFQTAEEAFNPQAAVAKLEFEDTQAQAQAAQNVLQNEADLEFIRISTLVKDHFDLGNIDKVNEIFLEFINAKDANGNFITGNLSKNSFEEFTKLKTSIDGKINKEELKKSRKANEASIGALQENLRLSDNFADATVIYNKLRKILSQNTHGHSAATIRSLFDRTETLYSKFKKENKGNEIQADKNEALIIVKNFQERMASGERLSENDLKEAQLKVKNLLGNDEAAIQDRQKALEVSYAVSQVSYVYKQLDELTNNRGFSPERFNEILSFEQKDIDQLPEGTAIKEISQAIFDAKKSFSAKSEVRTRINELINKNNSLYSSFEKELEYQSLLDSVDVYPLAASPQALQVYETENYSKLLGLEKGQPINFDNVQLGVDPDNPTQLEIQIQNDLRKGIIVPSLKKYLDSAAVLGAVRNQNVFSIFQSGAGIGRYGDRLNIWNRQGGNQLDPKTIARLGAALLLYEAGLAPSPEEALPKIVSNAQEVGGDITAAIEKAIGKKLDTWVSDTYSGADAITSERIKEAAIAIGFDVTSSKDLKRSIDSWIDVTFGTDKMVIGRRIDQDKVVGARTKYLNSSEMAKMNVAAYEKVYNSITENEQITLFRERTNLELIASLVEPEIAGQKIVPQFELKFKESTSEPGIYYIYAKTDMGLIPLKDETFEGEIKPPLFLDAFDFQEKENPHSYYGEYYTFYRAALQNDPNGAKYGNTTWRKYIGQKLGLLDPDVGYGPSQATIDAERALIFARFPDRINDDREEFDRLVKERVILPRHVDEFLGYAND